jgi:hypothetical protein
MWSKNKIIKEIEFIALTKHSFEVCPKPFPASKALPQWWKDATPYIKSPDNPDGKKIILFNRESNASFKKCVPMLDSLSSGYIFTLQSDVLVEIENNQPKLSWRVKDEVFGVHSGQEVEVPIGYHNQSFKYINYWIPKLPKGYSALIVPCFGYPNNIFKVIPAVIDYDKTTHPLFPPGFIRNDFTGILEKGTPMFQLIPFKRNNWNSKFSFLEQGQPEINLDRDVKSTIVNNYIKNFWEKKSYK